MTRFQNRSVANWPIATTLARQQVSIINKVDEARSRIEELAGRPAIDAFWYRGAINFGDAVTPAVLRQRGAVARFAPPSEASFVGAGSLLSMLPDGFSGIILGTGAVATKLPNLSQANILAVRGPLTLEACGAPVGTPFGDLGLIAPDIWDIRSVPEFDVGIVPHAVDKYRPEIANLAQHLGKNCKMIDVKQRPQKVMKEIAQCGAVISTSLHGVITADALGIPASWAILGNRVSGGDFKFLDHDYAIGSASRRIDPGDPDSVRRLAKTHGKITDRVRELQSDLGVLAGRAIDLVSSLDRR